MASVGHVAVGMAAARLYHNGRTPRWSSMASWSALSLLPDADVIGFALGVDYADPWGHRGATHSLALSVALGLAIGLGARFTPPRPERAAGAPARFKQPAVRTALFASVVLASHALLDTMTDGGLGCALLWPFDLARYFAPWRPIPVAPIGPGFLSPYGGIVALTELVLFSPILVFALRFPRIATKAAAGGFFLALWAVAAWLILSGDQARDAVVGFLLREDTAYASGFSEKAFRTITPGKSDQEVRQLVGEPIGEDWLYPPKDQPFEPASERSALALSQQCFAVRFEKSVVVSARGLDACKTLGIRTGMSPIEVDQRLGSPAERCWQYSRSPGGAHYRIRVVCFTNATVAMVIRQWN